MAQLTDEQVRHIAKLARLTIGDDEVSTYAKELTSILQYIDMLQEVDTKGIEASTQVTGLENAFREDSIDTSAPDPDDLLATSALPIVDHQIQTPSAHG